MMTQEEEERCPGATLFNRLQGGDVSTGSGSAGAGLLIPRRRSGSVPTGMEVSTCPDMAVVHGFSIWVTSVFSGEGGNKSGIDGGRNVG